jgi:hypothetical protein
MDEPLALRWGPAYYTMVGVLLVLGLAALILGFGVRRPLDIVVVSFFPLLVAAACIVCARQLRQLRATAIRPMKIVWAASIGVLAHGVIGLSLMGLAYAVGSEPTPVDSSNLKSVLIEIPLGFGLALASSRMLRSAKKLKSDGVLS